VASAESIEIDAKPCAIATVIDVTEQQKAQLAIQQAHEAVARAERHYRLMFNSVSDAVFVHKIRENGLPSNCFDVNDNACSLLGYTREELLQMRVVDIIAPEEHFNGPANAKRFLADGQATWEGRLAAQDGRRIPVEVHARVFDLDGTPTVISSVRTFRNVRMRKHGYRLKAKGFKTSSNTPTPDTSASERAAASRT
jgi:PAS domain S-box-containing protein